MSLDYLSIFECSVYFKITEHFTMHELVYSPTAFRHGLANFPTDLRIVHNLHDLCSFLEEVRSIVGCPLVINSAFRSDQVNKLVGGVPNSLHLQGLAADISLGSLPHYILEAAFDSAFKKCLPFLDSYKMSYIYYPDKKFIHVQLKPLNNEKGNN